MRVLFIGKQMQSDSREIADKRCDSIQSDSRQKISDKGYL